MTLDAEIEAAKLHLSALYKKRRDLRALARPPKRPRLQWGEVLPRAQGGQSLKAIAAEFNLKLPTVRLRLYWDINEQCYRKIGHKDAGDYWHENWREEYCEKVRINAALAPENRLRQRRFWPWQDAVHDGIAWNDPCWTIAAP